MIWGVPWRTSNAGSPRVPHVLKQRSNCPSKVWHQTARSGATAVMAPFVPPFVPQPSLNESEWNIWFDVLKCYKPPIDMILLCVLLLSWHFPSVLCTAGQKQRNPKGFEHFWASAGPASTLRREWDSQLSRGWQDGKWINGCWRHGTSVWEVLMDSKVVWPGNSSPLLTILPHSPPIRFGCDSNVCSQKWMVGKSTWPVGTPNGWFRF